MTENGVIDQSAVGSHWTHMRLVENLLNSSLSRDLSEAANEWGLERLDASEDHHNCQLCNHRIVNYVLLANEINGNKLIVGEDCYDKILRYLEVGKVESTMRSRLSGSSELRQYWRSELKKLPDRTVVGWL